MPSKATCFVVQGFGVKTDLRTGRRLNLDASYQVIRSAAEKSGYQCVRADEIVSGMIDKPLYERLWGSELVIADLSTSNMNVAYELGVRHALCPNTTIVVAEDQFQSPFEIALLQIVRYRHGGDTIEPSEAQRFEQDLIARIASLKIATQPDSPPYMSLPLLQRPERQTDVPDPVVPPAPPVAPPAFTEPVNAVPQDERTAKSLLDRGREAMDLASYWAAKIFLRTLCARRPNDESIMLLLSEATYRSRLPDRRASLTEARNRLRGLSPEVSNNPETLRQWGTVHRRLWEDEKNPADLDEAVNALERAFHATRRHEFATELAYLLNLRAEATAQSGDRMEAVADFVLARRMRRAARELAEQAVQRPDSPSDQRYWLNASVWEAAVGLEDQATAAVWRKRAEDSALSLWRLRVSRARIARIEQFLASSPLRALRPPDAPPKTPLHSGRADP